MGHILFGAIFIIAGLVVGVVCFFGGMFDPQGTSTFWGGYAAAAVLIGLGVICIWWW